ncbi:glycine zipper 2TM domain-containing protein [Caminibacter mediatlanticus]|uniref:17 kDa surface antigen n=1 Tax=Caminibacter mediatlanticus TB-2 TaxID=391592 RepID=A0AAI9AI91_9BACT|nr:glycine zipper 2TM domain-containing protein [Caminibacter mediatlanticus]EDM23964.1 17 kDa surface antigen [Caminibacter mediatlanticus TB-2]
MKKVVFFVLIFSMFIFSGCTKLYNSNEVSLSDVDTVLSYESGVVEDVKNVIIKDDGSGAVIGAYTGTVFGSMIGKGNGNILSTLLGGLTGAFVGYELDKANAQELFIKLDNGKRIVVISKGVNIHKGDRVRLIKKGSKIVRVEKM